MCVLRGEGGGGELVCTSRLSRPAVSAESSPCNPPTTTTKNITPTTTNKHISE